jgi:hypothetical protein
VAFALYESFRGVWRALGAPVRCLLPQLLQGQHLPRHRETHVEKNDLENLFNV